MRIGIDLGGSKTEGILMDMDGTVAATLRRETPATRGYDAILDTIKSVVLALEQAAGQTCHIGIGTPGSISSHTGALKNSNTVCLNGRPVKQDLEHMLGRKVRLENDANCFALSEALDGAAKDHDVVFGVIMGTGVGGGIVYQRSLHLGRHHLAGEWGHNVLDPDGPACYCGRSGCVETMLSGPALARQWTEHGGAPLTAAAIAELASTGDARASELMRTFLQNFGRALATVINILDPDVVVLGGGVSNIRQLYREGPTHIAAHVFNNQFDTPLLQNLHGDSSGVRGAAQLWPPVE